MKQLLENEPKQILFLIHGNDFAGTQKHILSYVRFADLNKVQIKIISLKDKFPQNVKEEFKSVSFEEYDFQTLNNWMKWLFFLHKNKSHAVIFVETWINYFGYGPFAIAWLLTAGNVYLAEHTDVPTKSVKNQKRFGALISFIRLLKNRSIYVKRILTVSNDMRTKLIQYYDYPPSKVQVAYTPIDAKKFEPMVKKDFSIRKSCKIPMGDTIVIVVSRLVKEKAIQRSIEAFSMLLNFTKRSDLWLWIVGDGYLRENLESLTRKRGIEGRVMFFGYRADVDRHLQESDIFVLPSEIEALPVSLMEAMCVGLVCIATSTAGAKELLSKEGFIVEQSAKSIFEALLKVVNMEKDQVRTMRSNMREYAVQHFNQERAVMRALEILDIPRD